MAYIGQGIKQGTFKVLDTSGNTYNGSNTTFSLGTQVGSAAQLLVSHDGVIQLPGTDYTLATGGTQITFSTAPASGASIFIVEISGAVGGTVTPSDNSVGITQLNVSDGSNGQALTTNGSGTLSFSTISTGLTGIDDQSSSNDDQVTITDTAVVINEDSDDVDFRVESNGNANMLFVSGGNDVVGVGAEGDLGTGLHIKASDSSASVQANADNLVIEENGNCGITMLTATNGNGHIFVGHSSDNDEGQLNYDCDNNRWRFLVTGTERLRIADGEISVNDGQTATGAPVFKIKGALNNDCAIITHGTSSSSSENLIRFRDGANEDCGIITINPNSNSVAYGTSSDYRLKENESAISDGITRLKQLKPYRFNFKADSEKTVVDGFFAHEVSSIVPEAISGEKDATLIINNAVFDAQGHDIARNVTEDKWKKGKLNGDFSSDSEWYSSKETPQYQQIDQAKLVPLLTAALQEAVTKIEALEARVTTLEG